MPNRYLFTYVGQLLTPENPKPGKNITITDIRVIWFVLESILPQWNNVTYATFISPKPGKNITITDIKVINYGFYGLWLNQYCRYSCHLYLTKTRYFVKNLMDTTSGHKSNRQRDRALHNISFQNSLTFSST